MARWLMIVNASVCDLHAISPAVAYSRMPLDRLLREFYLLSGISERVIAPWSSPWPLRALQCLCAALR
jgi:hypothetical protein